MADPSIDALALNETWLHPDVSDGLVHIIGYDIIRLDRDRNGGGVCIYIRSSLPYCYREDLIQVGLESVSVEVRKLHSRPFIISTIYRPPSSSVDIFCKIESLIKAVDNKEKKIIY